MAEFPQSKFEVGQRVFDIEGRTGLVSEVFFLPQRRVYRYVVDGIQDILDESELQDIPFGVSEPLTFRDRLAVNLEIQLQGNPGLDVRFWVGGELDVPGDVLGEIVGQPGGGSLEQALLFWAEQGFFPPGEVAPPPPEIEPPGPALDLVDVFAEVDRRIGLAIGPVVLNGITARDQLESEILAQLSELGELTNRRFAIQGSAVTDVLSRIQNSLSALEQEAGEATGLGLRGLLGLLGGFLRNPLGWFLERAEDAISEEILDGLTREDSDAVNS